MKALPWIITAAAVAGVIYVVGKNPSDQYAGSKGDLEDAADKAGNWGTKQRVEGTGGGLVGKVKEGAGKLTGDDQLQGEGKLDQAVGAIKDTVGKAAQSISNTMKNT